MCDSIIEYNVYSYGEGNYNNLLFPMFPIWKVQMVAKSIRRLMMSPFKTVYFKISCKNYRCKTIEATIMKTIQMIAN